MIIKERSDLTSSSSLDGSARPRPPTCQSRADAAAVHRAVAGAGLVHHVVKAQLLGVACTQNRVTVTVPGCGAAPPPRARLRTFVGGLRGRGLSCGPVGSDLSAS